MLYTFFYGYLGEKEEVREKGATPPKSEEEEIIPAQRQRASRPRPALAVSATRPIPDAAFYFCCSCMR